MLSAPEVEPNKLCKVNNKNIEGTQNKLDTAKTQPKTDVIHPDSGKHMEQNRTG